MPVKTASNIGEMRKKVVSPVRLSCRGIVQKFLLNHPGYFFSVTQIRVKIIDELEVSLNSKTIRAALLEIEELKIGLEKRRERAGKHNIHINFYSIRK